MLKADGLTYGPPGLPPLHRGLSFALNAGELLHVVGANGTGKSLLVRTLLGASDAAEGQVTIGFSGVRYLPQMQNRAAHLPYALGDVLGFEGQNSLAWANVGLLRAGQFSLAWNKASGGERQRTLLTRFFLQSGDLLILDEPFNHLDVESRDKVRLLLRDSLKSNPSAGALLISHDDEPRAWLDSIPVRTLILGGS